MLRHPEMLWKVSYTGFLVSFPLLVGFKCKPHFSKLRKSTRTTTSLQGNRYRNLLVSSHHSWIKFKPLPLFSMISKSLRSKLSEASKPSQDMSRSRGTAELFPNQRTFDLRPHLSSMALQGKLPVTPQEQALRELSRGKNWENFRGNFEKIGWSIRKFPRRFLEICKIQKPPLPVPQAPSLFFFAPSITHWEKLLVAFFSAEASFGSKSCISFRDPQWKVASGVTTKHKIPRCEFQIFQFWGDKSF